MGLESVDSPAAVGKVPEAVEPPLLGVLGMVELELPLEPEPEPDPESESESESESEEDSSPPDPDEVCSSPDPVGLSLSSELEEVS